MYNPHHLSECEKEKKRTPRGLIDAGMTAVGVVASVSSLPQALQIWRTGVVEGISLATYAISLGAVCAWFAYGLYIGNRPLTVTSGLSAVILGTVVLQLLVYS